MSESFHWWDFFPQLKSRFPNDQFHTAEILGNGKLYEHHTPLSIKKNITALREQVPLDGSKKVLFGFSLGGMLALEWAHAHPDEVEAVILVNCSLNNSAFYKRMTAYSLSNILKSGFEKDLHKREEMIIRMTTANIPPERVSEIALQWGPRGKEFPVKPLNFIWQLGVATQISQRAAPPAPVLVLSSSQDRVVHPDCSKKIADTWKLPLYSHPTAGHDLTLEDPDWVLDHVGRFIYPERSL